MKIKSGKYELFESGLINSPSMEEMDFYLSEDPPMLLTIQVKRDESKKDPTIELNLHGDSKLVITYTNPGVQLNFGNARPMNLGTLDGRVLYAIFRMNVVGDYNAYQLGYSLFLGEEAEEKV